MEVRITSRQPVTHLATAVLLLAILPLATAHAASLKLFVDASMAPGGDGSARHPFADLETAVNTARHPAGEVSSITINLAAGTYEVSAPIVIDFPLTLKGANVSLFDKTGRPTGGTQSGVESTIQPADGFGADQPLFDVRPATGAQTIHDVRISSLTLRNTTTAVASTAMITLQRVQDFVVTDLIIRGAGADGGINLSASSGSVNRTYVTGVGACGVCIAAGTAASPASVKLIQNHVVRNGAGGLLLAGTSPDGGDVLSVQVNDNSFTDNTTGNLGFGIRIMAIGFPDPPLPNAGQVTAVINGNLIQNNRYGLIVDAGFPPRNKQSVPATECADQDSYTGQLDLRFNDNVVSQSSQSAALVTTTRAQVWLAPQTKVSSRMVSWQYLHGATISIADPALTLSGTDPSPFRVDAPSTDPFLNGGSHGDGGACELDVVSEPLDNLVTYNGSALSGTNF
jgi:hypothetical protein